MRHDTRSAKIKAGTFAEVIHLYLASPKFDGLAPSTKDGYRYLLGKAERPELLGAVPVGVIRLLWCKPSSMAWPTSRHCKNTPALH
jgi:hypothetical protein